MKQPPLNQLFRLSTAAERNGVARTTLIHAANDGRLKTWSTGCELQLTTDAAVAEYLADDSETRGRPRRSRHSGS